MWKRNRNGATVCAPHPYFDSGTRTRASRPWSAASDSIHGKKKYGDGVTVDRSAPRESGGKLEVTNCDVQSGRQDGPAPAAVCLHRTRRHRSGSQEPVREAASSGTGRRFVLARTTPARVGYRSDTEVSFPLRSDCARDIIDRITEPKGAIYAKT